MRENTYAELKQELAELPMTWYPALIKTMIEAALEKGTFHPVMGVSEFVRSIETEWRAKHRKGAACPSCSISKR